MRAVRFSITFLVIAVISVTGWASVERAEHVVFKPTYEQHLRGNLATKFLANWHYKSTRLDDELSVKIFDRYLNTLDPNFTYFYASDIALQADNGRCFASL